MFESLNVDVFLIYNFDYVSDPEKPKNIVLTHSQGSILESDGKRVWSYTAKWEVR